MPFRRGLASGFALTALLVVVSFCPQRQIRAADYYLAPQGTGLGGTPTDNDETHPIDYSTTAVQTIIRTNPRAPGNNLVTLIFWPGTYLIDRLAQPYQTPAGRELELKAWLPADPPVLKFDVDHTDHEYQGAKPNHLFEGLAWGTWMLQFIPYSLSQDEPLARFEAHNLILDANWPEWALSNTGANPAYVSGFALGALRVQAQQGHIANVHIRNCGSNGITPTPYWSASGRECFPLFIEATYFGSGLWSIEDCEVSEFHALHGGYCTAIMVQAPNPGVGYDNLRVATVRRCQVRGNRDVIAFGSAASAGVTYSDNVVLNASRGLNHDTGEMRNFDFNNNILLDVGMLGNIGGAHWGPSGFVNYTIKDNAVRLRGVPLNQNYRSYEWISNTVGSLTAAMPVTDPALPIGRLETGYCVGLTLAGTDGVVFSNNRFTTRTMTDFYEPLPGGGNTDNARWTGVYRPHYDTSTPRLCTQTGSAVDNGEHNLLSSVAMDFTGLIGWPDFDPFPLESTYNGHAVFTNTFEEMAAIDYPPSGFMPDGWPGRVGRTGNGGQLVNVEEIQIGRPELTPTGDIELLARWVFHPTGASSTESWENQGGATAEALRLLVTDPEGDTSPVPAEPLGNWAKFTFSPTAGPGRYRLVVFNASNGAPFDPDESVWSWTEHLHGTTVRFERTPDVADDRRLNPGTLRISRSGPTTSVLSVEFKPVTDSVIRSAEPNVDFRVYVAGTTTEELFESGRYSVEIPAGYSEAVFDVLPKAYGNPDEAEYEVAYFQLLPAEGYTVASPAVDTTRVPDTDIVAVTFWDGPKYRLHPLDHIEYGGGASMAGGMGSGFATEEAIAAEPATLLDTNPPDEGKVELDAAVTGWPGPVEEALAQQLIAEGADPGPILDWWHPDVQAAMGVPGMPITDREAATEPVTVAFDDGILLSGQAALYTFAYGINNFGTGGSPLPKISGWAYMDNLTRPTGWWQAPAYDHLNPVASTFLVCIFYGVDDTGNLVGNDGPDACYYDAASGVLEVLGPLIENATARGNALSPNGSYAVGYSRDLINGQYWYFRPVRWYRSGTVWLPAEDLGSTDGILMRTAYAEDVKDDGVTVGRTFYPPSPGGYRAFRTPPDPGKITSSDDLLPLVRPQTDSPSLQHNAAYGINASGEVVGSSDTHYNRGGTWVVEKRAAFWKSTAGDPGFTLGVLQPNLGGSSTLNPGQSEAWAVNQREYGATVVGTGWATPTGEDRAFVCDVGFEVSGGTPSIDRMLNLNDPHLTLIEESGWVLQKAEDINDEGWIVGYGSLNGYRHGFLLVPYTISSQ